MRRLPALLALLLTACPRAPRPPTPIADPPRVGASVAIPGACVDPSVDARRRLGADAADGELRTERTLDLDGDGALDPVVAHPQFCGSGGCAWQLYVTRGACAVWVGSLFGIWPLPTEARAQGLVELEIAARNGCAGAARSETRARFDGVRYVAHATRECACPAAAEPGAPEAPPEPVDTCGPWADLPEPTETADGPPSTR